MRLAAPNIASINEAVIRTFGINLQKRIGEDE